MRLFVLFVSSFILMSNASSFSAEPLVIRAIVDDLDNLAGDTINEGSWDAKVIRDAAGNPTRATCNVEKSDQEFEIYTCSITFLLVPHEGEDIDSDPWESTCSDVLYLIQSVDGAKIIVDRVEDSVTQCIELLSEGPW